MKQNLLVSTLPPTIGNYEADYSMFFNISITHSGVDMSIYELKKYKSPIFFKRYIHKQVFFRGDL